MEPAPVSAVAAVGGSSDRGGVKTPWGSSK